jgi:hypothetical protein
MSNIKYSLLTLLLFILTFVARAQEETVARTSRDRVNITEKFNVLKSDKKTKQGLYQAYYDAPYSKTTLAASGMYDRGKKVGVWHYYGRDGSIVQHYDFTQNKLLYTIPDTVTKCTFDANITATDTLTRPVKIGEGYGYFDFMVARYDGPNKDMQQNGHATYILTHNLSVDTNGMLTNYQLIITADNFKQVYNIKSDALFEDDLLFVPATLNHKPIASTLSLVTVSKR